MSANTDVKKIRERFRYLEPFLNEKMIRLFAAAEALAMGYGGISKVAKGIGVSRRAITEGCKELKESPKQTEERIRKSGGGRKKTVEKDPTLKKDLEKLIDPSTRGDPESPLRWTCKSLRKLSEELNRQGHKTSHRMMAELLNELGYSLQANSKTKEGKSHPDRNAQFEYISKKVNCFLDAQQPIISVDAKKKELVGNFKNNGKEIRPKGEPKKVNVYDFPDPNLGKVTPYGVYDISTNIGWVNVGTDNDTAAFAVESIRKWWCSMGSKSYPNAKKLLITADGGGSNGSRVRLWKIELQRFASETGLEVYVSHFPPGTSKWNKIEHRLFSFVSQNWRGKPLLSHEVIVNLIGSTTTNKGLVVKCGLDQNEYPKGIKISDQQMSKLNLLKDEFHGEWNYKLMPNSG